MSHRTFAAVLLCLGACAPLPAPAPPIAAPASPSAQLASPAEPDATPLIAAPVELVGPVDAEPLVASRREAGWSASSQSLLAMPDDAPRAPASSVRAAAPPASAAPRAPAPASALVGEGFAFLGQERGIKVYRREKLPGIELAAEGNVEAPPEQVRRVLLDYPGHTRWQKHLKENKVLARGDGFLDVYQRLTLPVLDDRDFCLHVTWGSEGEVVWMRFATTSDRCPAPVSGVVRVTAHQGGWRLEPSAGGKATHAVYRFHLDLAGSFPAWMGKGQATSDIPDLFDNIRRELPRYR